MCGIFGIWHLDGKRIDLTAVQRATNMLRHRGPDDEGYLLVNTQNGRVVSCGGRDTHPRLSLPRIESFFGETFDLALAFRRLAILDLSPAGHQPMTSADGRFWIVFNGEIYNYVDLRSELSAKGYEFHTRTDAEVLLAAYQQWGNECLSRLNGMWAFVIWDQTERRLFVARDRLGIKPLYYVKDNHKITFASEIKALVGGHGLPFVPDEEAIYRYLVAGSLPSPRSGQTFFQRVQALPPGHWLTVRDQVVKTHRYWTLDSSTSNRTQLDALQSVQEYRELFFDAVRLRLQADVPVGSCLSGGVDSSSIVCVINQLMADGRLTTERIGKRQKTFSAVYHTAGPHNERQHIEKVLAATDAEANFAFPTVESLRGEIERLVWHQDEPFISTSMFAQWCVMREARDRGIKVLLDGQGADELLAGYRPYSTFLAELIREGRIRRALAEARAIQALTGIPAWSPLVGGLRHLLPHDLMDALRRRWYTWRQDWSVLNPDFAARWDHGTIADWRSWSEHQRLESHLRNLLVESSVPHLLRYEDRNSMAFGIESRVPYLDHRLVELSFGQVSSWRIRQGWTKWVLRKAMEGTVPDDILWRTDKVGFETPETEWLVSWMRSEPDFFHRDSLTSEYLDPNTVRRKIAFWVENGGTTPSPPLWRWINLELWLNRFGTGTRQGKEPAK